MSIEIPHPQDLGSPITTSVRRAGQVFPIQRLPQEILLNIINYLAPRLPSGQDFNLDISRVNSPTTFNVEPNAFGFEWTEFRARRREMRKLCAIFRHSPALHAVLSSALQREVVVDSPMAILSMMENIELGKFWGGNVRRLHVGNFEPSRRYSASWETLCREQQRHFRFLCDNHTQPEGGHLHPAREDLWLLSSDWLGITTTAMHVVIQYAIVLLLFSMTNLRVLSVEGHRSLEQDPRTAAILAAYFRLHGQPDLDPLLDDLRD